MNEHTAERERRERESESEKKREERVEKTSEHKLETINK